MPKHNDEDFEDIMENIEFENYRSVMESYPVEYPTETEIDATVNFIKQHVHENGSNSSMLTESDLKLSDNKRKKLPLWVKTTGVAVACVVIMLSIILVKNDVKKVSADEIMLKMTTTLDNIESYHIEIESENTDKKPDGQETIRKEKIVEYMKKPYFQRLETVDGNLSSLSISNGEKRYNSSNFSNRVDTNLFEIPNPGVFQNLNKREVIEAINNKDMKLKGETLFNNRTAYQLESKVIDYQLIDNTAEKEAPLGWRGNDKINARILILIDKETSVPLKVSWFKDKQDKPYRQSTYKILQLNEKINEKLFDIPLEKKVNALGWQQSKDVETAQRMVNVNVAQPKYLPEGAKLNRVGYINSHFSRIRLEYLVGKNVIYITYGWPFEDPNIGAVDFGGEVKKINNLWFYDINENFWSSRLAVRKGENRVVVEGTLSVQELAKIAESTLTPEEKKQDIAREKARKELIEKYKAKFTDLKVNKEKFTGKIKSLKIVTVDEMERINGTGIVKNMSTIYYKAPFYIHTEIFEDEGYQDRMISTSNINKNFVIPVDFRKNLRLTFEPSTYLRRLFEVEDEAIKSGNSNEIIRKVVGKEKYIGRNVTIIEYNYTSTPNPNGEPNLPTTEKRTLYVDDETGIILKQWDIQNGKKTNVKYITEIQINPEINDRLFEIPDNIKSDIARGYQEIKPEQLSSKARMPVKVLRDLPRDFQIINTGVYEIFPGTPEPPQEAIQIYCQRMM